MFIFSILGWLHRFWPCWQQVRIVVDLTRTCQFLTTILCFHQVFSMAIEIFSELIYIDYRFVFAVPPRQLLSQRMRSSYFSLKTMLQSSVHREPLMSRSTDRYVSYYFVTYLYYMQQVCPLLLRHVFVLHATGISAITSSHIHATGRFVRESGMSYHSIEVIETNSSFNVGFIITNLIKLL